MSEDEPDKTESLPGLDKLNGKQELRNSRFLAVGLLAVSLLFCGVAVGVMLAAAVSGPAPPLEDPRLEKMRSALRESPQDEELKENIREYDRQVRTGYLSRMRMLQVGAFLLVAGGAAVIACARWYASLQPEVYLPPDPTERSDPEVRARERRRRLMAVGAVGGLALIVVIGGALVGGVQLPAEMSDKQKGKGGQGKQTVTKKKQKQPAEPGPYPDGWAENWPRFRGPGGMGVVDGGDWPTSWDVESGENIDWQVEMPLPGNSSPVVWKDRIFLTGATAEKQEVYCVDRQDGEIRWRAEIEHQSDLDPGELKLMDHTGYASPTPVTDGERVFVFFATGDLAAVDFKGNVVWARHVADPENSYGIAVSPIYYAGKVILQYDRGTTPEGAQSWLIAFDPETGQRIWRRERKVSNSWATPVVAETEQGPQLLTAANPVFVAYDPQTGNERWQADVLSGDVAASPVHGNGYAYTVAQYAALYALQTDGRGDVTESGVAWKARRGLTDAPSPVCAEGYLLQVDSSGFLTCFDTEDGELVWDKQLDSSIWASPSVADGTVYLPGAEGKTFMFELGDSFKLKSTARLGEKIDASPAFLDGTIYLRGKKQLFCISSSGEGE